MWFYRTHDGFEVDLLITTDNGIWAIEIKTSQRVERSQASALRRLASTMPDEWLGGIVVYLGQQLKQLDQDLWAVPVGRLFG
jgi:hypothetical protein